MNTATLFSLIKKQNQIRTWEKIAEVAQKDEPVRGVVTHKVQGWT